MVQKRIFNRVLLLAVRDIQPNSGQARQIFCKKELADMADSITQNGILQPLLVRKCETGGYQIIDGERRLRGAKIAGLEKVPCIVVQSNDADAIRYALIENLQRQNLNFFEEARAIRMLIETAGITQEQAAARLGKSQSEVVDKLNLLHLTEGQRDAIVQAGLTEGHARALLTVADQELRERLLMQIIEKKLNVSQSKQLIQQTLHEQTKQSLHIPMVRDIRLFMNTVTRAVQTMKRSGVAVKSDSFESEDKIEYHIIIPKTRG